jgi:hypothetical protein
MNTLLDFAGNLLYLAFMIFLTPMLMFLYVLLSIWRLTAFLHYHTMRLLAMFMTFHPRKTPAAARREVGLHRRRLAGMHA